jgi:ligand-binding sensor domain-containing protein
MDDVQPGQTIGPYRIISQIGQGGMASVFKAYHAAMDRYVALKVLPPQLAASREFTGRFEHEARLIARLEHAHILPVHDYGEAGGHTYLAMRYVEAGTLKDRLRAGPLPPAEVDRLFTQLADALDYAHGQGVVHRDLKPANVLLDQRGNLFLTDFGIAKLLEGSPAFTSTGAMIGTPAYMSPEQAQGLRVDLRTDIYSLGIVLYEMVTGRVPFEADTPLAVILKHLNEPLPLPSSLKPDLPPSVERVLLKALAKQPDDRFATTAAFVAAWQAARPDYLAAAPPAAPRAPAEAATLAPTAASDFKPAPPAPVPAAPAARAPARSRASLGLLGLGLGAAALLGGLLVCAVGAWALYNAWRPASPDSPAATPTTALGASADGPWQSWAAGNTIYALALLDDGSLATGGPGSVTRWDLEGQAALDQLTTGNGLPSSDVYALLFDPDGDRLWIATSDGLAAHDGERLVVYRGESGLDSNVVTALALTSQGLVAGTAYGGHPGSGLNLFTGGWQPVPGFPSVESDTDPQRLSNFVTAILEDEAGDWWVGTLNGVGRFDGASWATFGVADGLPDSFITDLALVDGEVWVATGTGPARYVEAEDAFAPVPALEGWHVNALLQTSSGEVWASLGGGLARGSSGETEWTFYDYTTLPSYSIYAGVEAPDGTLFFGTDDGLLRFVDGAPSVWRVPNMPDIASFAAIRAGPQAGQLWFIEEYGSGSEVFDLARGQWLPAPELDCEYCVPLAQDPQGRLWAGGDLGAWLFNPDGSVAARLTAEQGLPADGVYGVSLAPTGEAWLATPGGVAVFDGAAITAVYDSRIGLASDAVRGVWTASDGALWVAADLGLSRLDPAGEWSHFRAGSPFAYDVSVRDLAEDASGAIWVATNGDGVYRFAAGEWSHLRPGDSGVRLPSADVNSVTVAPDGRLWFGLYYAGAASFDGQNWQTYAAGDGLIHSNVNDIFVDETGAVWFATSGGVSRYRP